MQNKCTLSIISPVYKAEKIVDELVLRIKTEAEKVTSDYEIILVEDGGGDNSWLKIEENCQRDTQIKGVKLSRNFGQHFAITAGLEQSKGNVVIVMDCDLQDNPVYFQELYQKYREGFDIVYTNKIKRQHSFFKNIWAYFFNFIFNFLIDNKDTQSSSTIGSYSLLSRKVVDSFLKINDSRRHYLMVLRWLGFSNATIEIKHDKRFEGKSSYNMKKLILHAIDGVTSQSDKLLRMMAGFGFILSLISFLISLIVVIMYFIRPFQAGWPSLIILILFLGGLIILSIGICGIYIGKIFEQTKNRPLYLIDKKLNL
jgi:glycosyltransferase involved in cell wall biosynthesis